MDRLLALRLNVDSANYDDALYRKLAKLGSDYVRAGLQVLDYYVPDFDVANDMANCYAPAKPKEFESRDRSAPENFIHPMAATEVATLATFVSQILFGGETTRKVEPRNPDDEPKADIVNELLAWNDAQQPTYVQGYHWAWDSIVFNRGILYDYWQEMTQVTLEEVLVELPYEPQIDPGTKKKIRKPRDWKPETFKRWRKKRTKVGGFCKVDPISPYDFICDPALPISRFQEGRFAGHRVVIPWQELKRRSELPPDDYLYVLGHVVDKLKNSKSRKPTGLSAGSATPSSSRSAHERNRRGQPVTPLTGTDKVNKEDGGVVECFCLKVRTRPAAHDIYDDEEDELIEFLMSGDQDLLSVNVLTNKHDEFPYAIGEARPNAHMQFSPSWTLIIKGPQDFVDYLKNRKKESLARTSGNIFVGNQKYIDFEAFTDPNKDGLIIPVTEEGSGKPLDQIIKQIPIQDTTARFHEEMMLWIETAEKATGAHAATQGQTEDPSQTATQFVGTQQMATGRISTIARLLSASALVGQTKRIVSDLQQFLPEKMTIRITGESDDFDPDHPQEKFREVIRDKASLILRDTEGNPVLDAEGNEQVDPSASEAIDIQGYFDVTPHDGSLPGTDARKVAALSRAVESFSTNPALMPVFDRTQPGSIDPFRLFRKLLKASGFPMGDLLVNREDAQKNLQEAQMAAGMGVSLPPAANGAPGAPAPPGPEGIPSAEVLPPIPSAAPPQVRPENAV